jgi:N4-gp56 family major capsid protein
VADALTNSAIFSQVLVAEVQDGLLENLRRKLVYGNPAYAEMGTFVPGADAIKFASIGDLSVDTTVLTEGTPPDAVALVVSSVTLDSDQRGRVVRITDLAKLKSPFDVVSTARERLSRNAAETIDEVVRDEIALAGSPFYAESGTTSRVNLDSTDTLTAAKLRKMHAYMFMQNIPAYDDDGSYLLIASAGQVYDLTEDTAAGGFIDTMKYTNPGPILNNEIGKIGGFRIIKAQNAPTVSNGTITVHQAFALGGLKGWGWGDLQTLRAYHTPPGGQTDPLHQNEKLGWINDFGVAALDNDRFLRLESAATDVTANNA